MGITTSVLEDMHYKNSVYAEAIINRYRSAKERKKLQNLIEKHRKQLIKTYIIINQLQNIEFYYCLLNKSNRVNYENKN